MKNSRIEWTHHTFNPVIGCDKVSPGCLHCYAETLNKRMGWVKRWSAGERKLTSESNWRQPLKWNEAAKRANRRERVFCASLADWLDPVWLALWRVDLLNLIEATPWLDWLLLTKRPHLFPLLVSECADLSPLARNWSNGGIPHNVWAGTTCENQEWFDRRIPALVEIPAAFHFISAEPLLGPIQINDTLSRAYVACINWVIVGGESGHGARPMAPEWARSLRDQCVAARIPFFFKQWGGVQKNAAGNELDGVVWDQYPGLDEKHHDFQPK